MPTLSLCLCEVVEEEMTSETDHTVSPEEVVHGELHPTPVQCDPDRQTLVSVTDFCCLPHQYSTGILCENVLPPSPSIYVP